MSTAAELDAADPLGAFRSRFLPTDAVAYLDGNSLGRPLTASADRIERVVRDEWGTRLIRGWDEGWIDLPLKIGDELARVCLGAAPGQTTIGDSTTVLLYKVLRAAIAARPGRDEVVIDRESFPTDRYVLEGIAADRGLTVRWIDTPLDGGVTPELVWRGSGACARRSRCSTSSPTGLRTSPTFPQSPRSCTTPGRSPYGISATRRVSSRSRSTTGASTSRSVAGTST